jgi:hypothetical protein
MARETGFADVLALYLPILWTDYGEMIPEIAIARAFFSNSPYS